MGGLTAGLVFGVACGTGKVAPAGGRGIPKVLSIRSVSFPGPFVPLQIVSADGKAWVEGTNTANYRDGCSLEEIDPTTLHSTAVPLPACGDYITTGGGLIYLAADLPFGNDSDRFHLEVFDPATRRADLLAPVITTSMGSDRAHMDMAYQDGWIWLSEYGSSLWKISAGTGRVVSTITDAPPSVGGHGILVGAQGGLWLTPGPSSRAAIYRIASGSTAVTSIYTGPRDSSVLWLAAMGGKVWAAVASHGSNGQVIDTSLRAFSLSGRPTLSTGSEEFGDIPFVGATGRAWSIGGGPECTSPQRLWFVNPTTGRSSSIATLVTPIEPCLTENPTGSQTALAGSTLLVLEATGATSPPAVLYSIRTHG